MNTPDDDFIGAVGNIDYAKIKSVDIDRLLRICDSRKAEIAKKDAEIAALKEENKRQADRLIEEGIEVSSLQGRVEELEGVLKIAQEAMIDRRLYAADAWDWKYGKVWDEEDALIKAALGEG